MTYNSRNKNRIKIYPEMNTKEIHPIKSNIEAVENITSSTKIM